jgi:hypothetical protein
MMGKRIAANSSVQLLLHHRDFSLVWTAGLISMMGDWILWIVLPIRVSAIYQRLTGARYAAQRTFAPTTLNVPFGPDGRTALLEARGARVLDPADELNLRFASTLPFGKRRLRGFSPVAHFERAGFEHGSATQELQRRRIGRGFGLDEHGYLRALVQRNMPQ